MGDLDDALIRPGRCFAWLSTRELSKDEAKNLLVRICTDKKLDANSVEAVLYKTDKAKYSLAEIYKAVNEMKTKM